MQGKDPNRELITLMYVPGQAGNIRRIHFPRHWIRRAMVGAAVAVVVGLTLSVDYVRARHQLTELDYLRTETRDQREQLKAYSEHMTQISEELQRIARFDQKLRVITNMDPADPLPLPGIGGVDGDLLDASELAGLSRDRRHKKMLDGFDMLSESAVGTAESLSVLMEHLESQTARLRSTPSVSPTKGWMTSSFGHRTSPFTGNREFHRGLDIAGRLGTPVLAPADGVVRFAGTRRALGNSVTLKHGYGIQSIYGHLHELAVKPGQKVVRGQTIGLLGTTGRSTGPHLHYQVEVNGAPVNPRNYILD